MQRTVLLTLFLILFLVIDWYIFSGVKQLIKPLSQNSQRIITILYWAIPIISILMVILGFFVYAERLTFQTRTFLASFVLIIYLSKIFAAVILLIGDITLLFRKAYAWIQSSFTNNGDVIKDSSEQTISRSEFITKTALAVGGAHIGVMTWGIISGAHDYRIKRVPLKLTNLPQQFHGLKLIQISDIHSGSFFNKTAVEGGVDMILNEKPDMVFFTGDIVNNKAEELNDYFDIFKRIQAPLGVYSTLGNHDYGDYVQWTSEEAKIQNIKDLMEAHRLMNWNLLMDEHKEIKVDGDSLGILGIQNWGHGFAQYGNLEKALLNTDQLSTKLLLSHDPTHWRHQVLDKTNIDASFAGHTHGMQYGVEIGGFKWSPAGFRYKEWAGLYKENEQQLYINRGYGYLGYPGRVGILPEITVFELTKA
ncbi:metallophosphoesterase [Arcticibacterium luteifluviistationis]|uniref:Metallophosphatase n=1 Tax=Arcticibacterium luteifluviistationis TaxID=1784714 RepID=A0A2Z4GDQ1_9BACT|nr:metallophosphoesterase [Arcticibacterium luteifluviistationis]AWV99439.1 metallophosphatase [Arcticibacterium luteifluviistationis]